MKRTNQFFSPLSLSLAGILFVALGMVTWRLGGLEFNPGPLTAFSRPGVVLQGTTSHADFETRCAECHQPATSQQAALCTRCHLDVGGQMSLKSGLHGSMVDAASCRTCHPDHRGRNFDPTRYALLRFDHSTTGFSLTGVHSTAACTDCHQGGSYEHTSRACVGCHAEPEKHQGMYSQDCAACHDPAGWKPALIDGKPFDHSTSGFVLDLHAKDYAGQAITCHSCHSGPTGTPTLPACQSCHNAHAAVFMTTHLAQYGADCLQCHDGKDRMHGFNHAAVLALDGGHANLSCATCHANQNFKSTPAECSGCHQEPAIHAGVFGLKCAECHTASAWQPARLVAHTFPINHTQAEDVACVTCHTENYTSYTCYGCHDHQADEIARSHARLKITDANLPDCARCHPAGTVVKQ